VRPRLLAGDDFAGVCPAHGNCLEGLVSGPANEARTGCRFDELPDDHPVRQLVARYLGEYCAELALILSPARIVIGGGVMTGSRLHDAVAEAMRSALGDYMPRISGRSGYICAPALGDRAGLIGAFALAADLSAGEDS
jgi:fructokinase